jgi:chemotaxis protein histidine kinase CheA
MDAAAGTQLDKILSHLDALHARMDAMEEKEDKKKADAEETIRYFGKGHNERKDGEDEEKGDSEKAEKEKADKEKTDAEEKEREDAEKKRKDAEADDKKQLERDKESEKHEKKELKEEKKDSEKEMADALALSDVRSAIKRIERNLPKQMSDEDYAELAEAQSHADAVFHAFGEAAPRPLMGEDAGAYRRRVSHSLKKHSPKYKEVDIYKISDAALYNAVEETIYADAMGVASSPATAPAGSLRAVKKTEGGHTFVTYVGDPAAWMNEIAGPARSYVTAFNTQRSA